MKVKVSEAEHQNNKRATMARATSRVAITHLQTILYRDVNKLFDDEKAARDWLESIGEEP